MLSVKPDRSQGVLLDLMLVMEVQQVFIVRSVLTCLLRGG